MISRYFLDRARKGMDLLDQTQPNWWQTINLATLDIEYQDTCVLGQLHGDYNKVEGFKNHDDSGFHLRHLSKKNWRKLTQAWTYLILERQAA